MVAILFESAPRTKAVKAERVTAVFPVLFWFVFNSLSLSWSNTVYCNICNSCLSVVDSLKQNEGSLRMRLWSNLYHSIKLQGQVKYLNCGVWGQQKRDAKAIKRTTVTALCQCFPKSFRFAKGTCLHSRGGCIQGLHNGKPNILILSLTLILMEENREETLTMTPKRKSEHMRNFMKRLSSQQLVEHYAKLAKWYLVTHLSDNGSASPSSSSNKQVNFRSNLSGTTLLQI